MRVRSFIVATVCVLASVALPEQAEAFVWPSTVDRVGRDLHSADPAVRRKAARRLFDLPEGAVRRLAPSALSDAEPDVRVAALEALSAIHVPKLGERVAAWLGDNDGRVRRAAALALARQPYAPAVPALGRVLSDPDATVRTAAARALGVSGVTAALVPLLGRLDDSDPDVREAVAVALARLGDRGAVVPLIGKIQDSRPNVRKGVATALGVLGDARAESALVLLLRDPDETVRIAALNALGRIHARDAVATVTSLLQSERRAGVREAALMALAALPSDAAVDALVRALASDDPREHSPVRAALARAGARAVPQLSRCLEGQPAFDLADGCALALGEIGGEDAARVVSAALRRGVVRPVAALAALAASKDGRALATVFEYLSADDVWVRRAALDAALSLLDPREPDGRAVEPITRALDAAHGQRSERSALVELLGKTGSSRAAPLLERIAVDATDPALRLVAVTALGSVGRSNQDAALLASLSSEHPAVRLAAASSLRKTGSKETADALLMRLEDLAEQDREALEIALAGPLSVTTDAALVQRAVVLAKREDGGRRDIAIEAIAAAPAALGSAPLLAWLKEGTDAPTRAKIAEALGRHPEALASVTGLARDPEPSVRANALWALSTIGGNGEAELATAALADPDPAVAGDAAAALGGLLVRGAPVRGALCASLVSGRTYVRVNALVGLAAGRVRCDDGVERTLLQDESELVRAAAARLLATAPADVDRLLLSRCAAEDPSANVAMACAAPTRPEKRRAPVPVSVFVVPAGAAVPMPAAPYALVRADGYVRLGFADRRGSVYEQSAPDGPLALALPAPVVR
jgi:HEAT repeat protein